MKRILWPLLALLAWGLLSCAPQTIESRIQTSPEKFAALPARHRELVRNGQIDRGMNQDAVYFAWGSPNRVFEGAGEGGWTTRWDYIGLQTIYRTGFYGGYGYGGGYGYPYGRYSRGYPYFGVAPQVDYMPCRSASVFFKQGTVASWERVR
jgi:hypothetical protein